MSKSFIVTLILLSFSSVSFANQLQLVSHDIKPGQFMTNAQEFNGFGCTGKNVSPHLKWSGAPKGTKSFAITVYDPDAPTGSGWWHWQLVNIPATVKEVARGAGSGEYRLAPKGSVQNRNDYGSRNFGGACPPIGHGIHHYRFTLHALSVERLELPENASGALTGYMINANTIASTSIEALYKRE
mgnify:CR=1 FL=1